MITESVDTFKYYDSKLEQRIKLTKDDVKEQLFKLVKYHFDTDIELYLEVLKAITTKAGHPGGTYIDYTHDLVLTHRLNPNKAIALFKFYNRARKEMAHEIRNKIIKELENNTELYKKFKEKIDYLMNVPNWIKRADSTNLFNTKVKRFEEYEIH